MYYVNREQIGVRLQAVDEIAEALHDVASNWQGTLLQGLAQERALHLAIETVTDVGSYLIDGFIMRDASSYEDIIEITGEEGVFPANMLGTLIELVKLRRPLVQEYFVWPRSELHPLSVRIADLLPEYKAAVEQYLEREL
ncbi:DUF86 domain-containing protein [Paenibacillus harenae]|uniref:Uncharacterized protein YutE (UPF0331/DUF86 family) n=1 Tax=Paenibacillus harenae TaxID=306543 RepID=A0ABT9U0J3_PAEHA|nr:HepT-like ribonuclease domain-containing protein [Paenibacillus harenae]MDQ0111819.1 uncharacterized protein YutE (UPF0331/DUF86 family) [Paenibacillus harenae]